MTIKLITLVGIISLLLSPVFASAKVEPINIASPIEGFIQGQQEQILLVSGSIRKNLWDNRVSKRGGAITIYASAANKQVLQSLDDVTPIVNERGRIIAYNYNLSLHIEELRGTEDLPIRIWVEATNRKGKIIATDEVWGTIKQVYSPALAVTLASNNPPSSVFSKGAADANFVSIAFTAGTQENIMIQQLTLTRNGGTDDDLLNVRVFDGSTQVGIAAIRFVGGKITLSGLNWVIPKDSTRTLMVKVNVDVEANTYGVENGVSIGIVDSSNIQALGAESASVVNITNFVSVMGNAMGISVAE